MICWNRDYGNHRIGRVVQPDRSSIGEDDHRLVCVTGNGQTPIFYRNWPGKRILSTQDNPLPPAGTGTTPRGFEPDPECTQEQSKRGEPLDRISFPDAGPALSVVGTREGVLLLEILDDRCHQPARQLGCLRL